MAAKDFGDRLLQGLLEHLVQASPGGLGASVSVAEPRPPRVVAATGVATEVDSVQWGAGDGPGWQVLSTGQSVVLPDAEHPGPPLGPGRWPEFESRSAGGPPGAAASVVRGLVAVPGEWGSEHPFVLATYLDMPPDFGQLERVDRFGGVVAMALALIEHCSGEEVRADQMVQMMQYRRVIEQAKGLVMGAVGGDGAAAFNTLARASQHFNVRLRNLAVALVEHVGGGQAEGPQDPAQVIRPSELDRSVAAQVWAALAPGAPQRGGRPAPSSPSSPSNPSNPAGPASPATEEGTR